LKNQSEKIFKCVNKKEVNKWMTRNQFDKRIQKSLQHFDGELLDQFYQVSREAPEYFFKTLSHDHKVELFAVVKFINELNKLFRIKS
jgi:hypothetical protein